MPNHCENDLYISGPKEDVDALLALIGADQTPPTFDFNALLPYPAGFKERDDAYHAFEKELGWKKAREAMKERFGDECDGYNAGGYEWCRATWGTKWNAYDVVRRDYGEPCVTFQTAWSPPIQVIAELHRRFPRVQLALEYFERGVGHCGGATFLNEEDHSGAEPWKAGVPSQHWHLNGYRGRRGG